MLYIPEALRHLYEIPGLQPGWTRKDIQHWPRLTVNVEKLIIMHVICDLSRENVPYESRVNSRTHGKLTGDSRVVKSFSRLKPTTERLQKFVQRVSSRAERAKEISKRVSFTTERLKVLLINRQSWTASKWTTNLVNKALLDSAYTAKINSISKTSP